MKKLLLFSMFLLFVLSNLRSQQSVAHQWTEKILFSITNDFARPPVHARNLHHLSVVMHDAFAAYQEGSKTILLDNEWHGFYTPFYGVEIPNTPAGIVDAQEEAISFAAYRLLLWRFQNAPGVATIYAALEEKMLLLGYDISITSVDYVNDGPAALGNYIAQQMIAYGLQDGSNESNNFASQYYTDGNPFLYPAQPGNPTMVNPNRFQRLSIENAVDQAGNPINGTPPHLAPEWGNVNTFSMKIEDSDVIERDGGFYRVYHNPGPPVYLDTNVQTGFEDFFKWNFLLVSAWQSHLDTTDNVMWDISPASGGNIPFESLPDTWADYLTFYDFFNGGDPGTGYALNPITGLPYEPQLVRRGDYARVLAEFWADGLDSETPPGHWFNIYNEISQHPLFVKQWKGEGPVLSDLEYDIKAYVLLGGSLHDAAIGAWGIKGCYDYVRPISAIRYLGDKGQSSDPLLPNYHPSGVPIIPGYVELVMPGDPLVGDNDEHLHKIKLYTWRGHEFIDDSETDMAGVGWILSENFWTYQKPSFVTPPFAGYISGHSTFSRTAATVMHFMTGTPYFPGGMSNFVAEQNEFLDFEQGPSQTVVLQWATYYDASDQCSLSRIWGGIHPPMDDIPGRKIGHQIGTGASEFADSIYNTEAPIVVDFETSNSTVNIATIGSQLVFTITYDVAMNTSINPTVVFLSNPSIEDLLTVSNQTWLSATEFEISYLVENVELELGAVALSVIGAEGLNEYRQNPALILNEITVDTKAPILVSYEVSEEFINAQTTSVCVTLNFDEACSDVLNPVVSWSGTTDIDLAMSVDLVASSWTSDNTYVACFEFDNQASLSAAMLSVTVDGAIDLSINPMNETLLEEIVYLDVVQPELELVTNAPLYNISNVGNGAVSITLTSSKEMETSVLPVLSFSDNAESINVFTINNFLSSWTDANTCVLVYNLAATPVDLSNVDIAISNIWDLAQNQPSNSEFADAFILDTKRPDVDDMVSNYEIINDAAAANGDFYIEISFSEEMNQVSFAPLVVLKNNLGAVIPGVSYNLFQSSWTDAQTYRARFNVQDLNVELTDVQIEISLARDISDNAMNILAELSPVNVDTRNPQLAFFEASESVLGQTTTTITLSMSFDEAMDENVIPNFMAVTDTDELPMFTPIPDEGSWINAFTYSGQYTVNHIYYQGSVGMRVVDARDVATNLVKDTTLAQVFEVDFIYLSIEEQYANSIVMYPNPVSAGGVVNLILPNGTTLAEGLRIFDLLGNLVQNVNDVQQSGNQIQFSTAEFSTGLYLIQLNIEGQLMTFKLQIQ